MTTQQDCSEEHSHREEHISEERIASIVRERRIGRFEVMLAAFCTTCHPRLKTEYIRPSAS